MENWKPIAGFEGRYEVSDEGRIAYVANGTRDLRKTKEQGQGYPMVCFRHEGRPLNMRVHRLVAEAFVPNPESARTVNHIDGNKSNNRADNLEWVSQRTNNAHAVETGLLIKARGERINTARLTADDVRVIKARLAAGETRVSIAPDFGVHRATIDDIAAGRSWKHV